jgi:hypothetical protein
MEEETQMVSSRERYVAAAIITTIIFALGFTLGLVGDNLRADYVQNQLVEQKIDRESSQMQYNYISSLEAQQFCPAIIKNFNDNLATLDDTRFRLQTYIRDNTLGQKSFDLLKREYTLEQIRYWFLSKKAQETCNKGFTRVLYVYAGEDECDDCEDQQTVLLYFKQLLEQDLLIFSIDSAFVQEPMIELLMSSYNVTEFPTIVVNEQAYSGYQDRDEFQTALCLAQANSSRELPFC